MTTTIKSNIGKEDIRQFGGNNRTFQRRNSAGALLTLHSVGNVVDVLQAYGDGTTPTQADLSDAIVGANGNEVTFELAPGTWPITSNLTIPSTVTLHLLRGAAFTVATGITLTINGPVFADDTAWYSGAGTVAVAATVSQVTGAAIKAGTTLECGTTLAVGTALTVGTTAAVGTNATVGGTLGVTGAATVGGTLGVTGALTATDLSASGTLGGKLAFRGALVCLGSNQLITGVPTFISFGAETYDTSSIHDNSTNPSRLTVPAGVTRVKLKAQVIWGPDTVGTRSATIFKNNSEFYAGRPSIQISPPNTIPSIYIESPVLTVTAGDYFELSVLQTSGSSINVIGDADNKYTWFAMEVVE